MRRFHSAVNGQSLLLPYTGHKFLAEARQSKTADRRCAPLLPFRRGQSAGPPVGNSEPVPRFRLGDAPPIIRGKSRRLWKNAAKEEEYGILQRHSGEPHQSPLIDMGKNEDEESQMSCQEQGCQ
jgi:hypothetical protein